MAHQLSVNFGDQVIGQLSQDPASGLLKLQYNEDWQQPKGQQGFPLSPILSLNNIHPPAAAYNFLDNLLPEGEARSLLAQDLGVSEKNIFPQIHMLGWDLAGTVSFGELASKTQSPDFRPISNNELIDRLQQKEQFGLLHWDDKPRLSIAGVQDKLNVFIDPAGNIGFGEGALCSTHILKFEKANCRHLVLNEYFCMKLSKAAGLPTAEVSFRRFGEHPALLVTRFDRKYVASEKRVLRRHVIDGCQALNLPREYKYERNFGDGRDVKHIRDGASLEKLFNFCRSYGAPVQNSRWLINWQLFNLMISNYDSHGKNLSFYWHHNSCQFTPAYDLVNVAMFKQFKHVLAMGLGDEFEPEHINAYQLADFAEACQLDTKLVANMLQSLAKVVMQQLQSQAIVSELEQDAAISAEEKDYLVELSQHIYQRVEHLVEQSKAMVSITL